MGIKERKEREKQIRRQQIQDAAKEVFLEKGFRTATMEDIALRAELSPATIYLYFKNKDELYASLNLLTLQFLQKQMEGICNDEEMAVEKKLLQIKKALLDTYRYDPLILRNILHMQVGETLEMISPDLLSRIQTITRQISKGVGSIFEQGIKEGKFINEHVVAQSDLIWALFTGIVMWETAKKRFNPKKDYLETEDKIIEHIRDLLK